MSDLPTSPPAQMLAADVVKHPEYKNSTWNLKPTASGLAEVAKKRGGPFKISWEVHGTGDVLLVWVMGLGALKTAYQRQTWHFGHLAPNSSKYSCLILDNRGMGGSDKPVWPRYSTSEMARDVLEVLEVLGGKWAEEGRRLHVVGASMGGMIAQEIAYLVPERIASLSLVVTAARLVNTQSFVQNLRQRINLFIPHAIDDQLSIMKARLFSASSINGPDTDYLLMSTAPNFPPPAPGNPPYSAFPTLGDRIAAGEITKRNSPNEFTRKGFMMQAIAAGWHHKSTAQIAEIANKVGRGRITVVTGGRDNMITPPHGFTLRAELNTGADESGDEKVRWEFLEEIGHVPFIEARDYFNQVLTETFEKGEKLGRK